jgi:hypothetical protein
MVCKAAATCNCRIEGSAVREGSWVELTANGLERVLVVVHDRKETVAVLTKKYGPQNVEKQTGTGLFDLPELSWRSPNGETIEFHGGGTRLVYTSGARNSTIQSKDRANKSVF